MLPIAAGNQSARFSFSVANYSLKLHKKDSIRAALHGIRQFHWELHRIAECMWACSTPPWGCVVHFQELTSWLRTIQISASETFTWDNIHMAHHTPALSLSGRIHHPTISALAPTNTVNIIKAVMLAISIFNVTTTDHCTRKRGRYPLE